MASQGIGSLATLIKRLEAATSRLEDIATSQSSAPIADQLASQSSNTLSTGGGGGGGGAPPPPPPPAPAPPSAPKELPSSIIAFDSLLSGPLTTYLTLSNSLSNEISSQSRSVQTAFTHQRSFLLAVVSSRDPGLSARDNALTPTANAIGEVLAIQEKSKDRKEASLLKTVSEGVVALSWVQYEKPGAAVQGQKESSEFYANRVIKEFKDSEPKRVEWARSFMALLSALEKYVKEYFPTGLVWNPKGDDFQTSLSSATSSSAPAAPPAPPPPPPPASAAPAAAVGGGGGDMSALFASLNQGSSVTSSLRKVDPSQMTHKNPSLRREGGVPDKSSTAAPAPGSPGQGQRPPKPPKPASFQKGGSSPTLVQGQGQGQTAALAAKAGAGAQVKQPKLELEGKKWVVENFDGKKDIVIDNTELSHQVNIYNCKNSVIQVKGKVNAVTLVSSTKTSLLLDTLVSSLSITSSPSFTVQILGRTPTIMIDATDSGQVYLSKDCLDVEIVTAKASAINVSLPVEGEEEGVFEERAVPEQLKTVVKGGKLVTTVLEHAG